MAKCQNEVARFLRYFSLLGPDAREVVREIVIDTIRVPKKKPQGSRRKQSGAERGSAGVALGEETK